MPKLFGGRKAIRAKIERTVKIGQGTEGKAFYAYATLKKGRRKKTVPLVEKKFFFKYSGHASAAPHLREDFPLFRNPKKQFEIAQELKEANKKHNLGLRIMPTVRLKKRLFRKPTLLTTRLLVEKSVERIALKIMESVANRKELKNALRYHSNPKVNEFFEDMLWQTDSALSRGYVLPIDCFLPVFEKKENRVVAVIADFGTVIKLQAGKQA